ncbi:MAG TPA: glyoxalase superfamily protein [Vicinamibacterales bacterium]|jgi:uncharacterized glyoxalase superfamily protein PhnB
MSFGRTIPILRMFDAAKAREFYIDFLGFTIDDKYARPGINDQPWGTREVCVTDPSGNKLTFASPVRA